MTLSDKNVPIEGGQGTVPALGRPDLILAAPSGVVSVTPASHMQAAGATMTLVAQQDIHHLAGQQFSAVAEDGIVLFTQGQEPPPQRPVAETGMRLHAASGSVHAAAHTGAAHLVASADVSVSSTTSSVRVSAPKGLLLAAAGAAMRIEQGRITLIGPGTIELKAGMKVFTGPASVDAALDLPDPGPLQQCPTQLSAVAATGAGVL